LSHESFLHYGFGRIIAYNTGIFVISFVEIEKGTRIERVSSPCLVGRPAPSLRLRGKPAFVVFTAEKPLLT
jgi:hypothetical protein